MEITDIKIRKTFEEGPLRAILSVTFADSRQFVVMPSRKNADGTYEDIVHPINSEFRKKLEDKLLSAYNTHLIEMHDDGVIEFQLT